jgi:HEAT repeat protein
MKVVYLFLLSILLACCNAESEHDTISEPVELPEKKVKQTPSVPKTQVMETISEKSESESPDIQKDSVEDLIKQLENKKNTKNWLDTIRLLGENRDPRAVEPLVALLPNFHGQYLHVPVGALVNIGEPAVEPLIELLNHKDRWARTGAAIALGKIGDKRAVEPLINVLQDSERNVRWYAAESLGMIGDKRAVLPLIKALSDSDVTVSKHAAEALGNLGDSRAVEPLINVFEKGRVRESAIAALGKLGDDRIEKCLLNALRDRSAEVRREALKSIHLIGSKKVIEELVRLLKDSAWYIRRSAVDALVNIGDAAVNPLLQALSDDDATVRANAASAFSRLKDERAIEPLVALLGDGSHEYMRPGPAVPPGMTVSRIRPLVVKFEAARSLKSIGMPALESLEKALTGESDYRTKGLIESTIRAIKRAEKNK